MVATTSVRVQNKGAIAQMKFERFIYIDAPGIASLYAQLHGRDVVETLLSMEHSRASGWKVALGAFLGLSGSGEATKTTKEARASKVTLRPENMLREISASLRARGTLHNSVEEAIDATSSTPGAAWFEARHSFSIPPQIEKFNEMRTVLFVSGFPPYEEPSVDIPQISMSASLHHFPTARDSQIGISGHDALFIRSLNGKPYSFAVFGSIFSCGDGFQIKPYALHL
jgi:hypothetical protein